MSEDNDCSIKTNKKVENHIILHCIIVKYASTDATISFTHMMGLPALH